VVFGGWISINLKKESATYEEKKLMISRAGWLAGLGLFLIYTGLILTGALNSTSFYVGISRTGLLSGISTKALGNTANLFLSILVALACFTTAIGIVTGTADFVKSRFKDSQKAYILTAILGCVLGVVMGQFNVEYIIAFAVPALMFIYPITIVLILLNVIPDIYASPLVFRTVIITTILFSVPDFLDSIGISIIPEGKIFSWIPLSEFQMGWILPALVVFASVNILKRSKKV